MPAGDASRRIWQGSRRSGHAPPLLIRAWVVSLWVFGFTLRRLVWRNGSRRRGWSRGAGAWMPTMNVRGRSRVGKAKPVREGADGPCQGACESAELVRVRYERHSLLFDRSWRELTPPPLYPSERARTR
jgi:hypothetical protein